MLNIQKSTELYEAHQARDQEAINGLMVDYMTERLNEAAPAISKHVRSTVFMGEPDKDTVLKILKDGGE